MLLETITGKAAVQSIIAQKPIAKLLLVKTGADYFDAEKITIQFATGDGNSEKVVTDLLIKDLATISQFGAGYNLHDVQGANKVCHYIVDVTGAASLNLSGNRQLTISLSNLTAASEYKVYGLEIPFVGNTFLQYSANSITGSQPQSRVYSPDAGTIRIAIAGNGALSNIRLKWSNGNESTYDATEAAAMMRELNDLAFAPDTFSSDGDGEQILAGAASLLIIPASAENGDFVTSYEVNTTGTAECKIITVTQKLG